MNTPGIEFGRGTAAAYAALCKVLVVPFHLFCQTISGMSIRAPGCQHMYAVADLRHLTEHNCRTAPHQHICCIARAGIG